MKQFTLQQQLAGEIRQWAYTLWTPESIKGHVVCVHGLTRNSRDFDFLASDLTQAGYQVACPDIIGRGQSDWLENKQNYQLPTYVQQCQGLLNHLGWPHVDWIGTSMGGIIGMALAALPTSPITRLVLNDVGPHLPASALSRIYDYLSLKKRPIPTYDVLKRHIQTVYAEFGSLTDEQWDHLIKHSAVQDEQGHYILQFDPEIRQAFGQTGFTEDIGMWPLWEAIRCPVLVLRGTRSDLLTQETAEKMRCSKPNVTVIGIPNVGHAPALMDTGQRQLICDWLLHTPV